jgi:integrase
MPKGSVNIEVFNDRLRLAWSWEGKRFWLYIALPDTKPNRKAAQIKARTMAYRPATLRTRHRQWQL